MSLPHPVLCIMCPAWRWLWTRLCKHDVLFNNVCMSDLARSCAPRLSDVWVQMHGPIDHKIAACVFLALAAWSCISGDLSLVRHLSLESLHLSIPPSRCFFSTPHALREGFWNQLSASVKDWLDLHTELLLLLCQCGCVSSGAGNARRTFLIPL